MDLTHSAWSDIFFLGMDYPQGARVLNVSIDLAVRGRDAAPKPPVEAYLRVIDEPVLRLVSVDLATHADITNLPEVFDFAKDYLGLLKAAVIASGIVPPGIEGSGQDAGGTFVARRGPGARARNRQQCQQHSQGVAPGGLHQSARLADLRVHARHGPGQEPDRAAQRAERRLVAARAILGEWIGGSGGGWQDSGGVWPGMKLIEGSPAQEGDPEFGISRGRLLPTHQILDQQDAPDSVRQQLQESLVLVHGGMAQNVGPILEMVTEKYLLRSAAEWDGATAMRREFSMQVLAALKSDDVRELAPPRRETSSARSRPSSPGRAITTPKH